MTLFKQRLDTIGPGYPGAGFRSRPSEMAWPIQHKIGPKNVSISCYDPDRLNNTKIKMVDAYSGEWESHLFQKRPPTN